MGAVTLRAHPGALGQPRARAFGGDQRRHLRELQQAARPPRGAEAPAEPYPVLHVIEIEEQACRASARAQQRIHRMQVVDDDDVRLGIQAGADGRRLRRSGPAVQRLLLRCCQHAMQIFVGEACRARAASHQGDGHRKSPMLALWALLAAHCLVQLCIRRGVGIRFGHEVEGFNGRTKAVQGVQVQPQP